MSEDLQREEVADQIDRAVEELLQAAEFHEPPVNTVALAQRHLGIVLDPGGRQPRRREAQQAGGRRKLDLRPEPTEERRQWTVAHEIGEHLKPSLLQRLGIEPEQTRPLMGESLANLFAYRLLVPGCWFAADAPNLDYDLLQLKERYRTASHEIIAWRILDLPEPCIITILDNDHVSRRRSNAWQVRRKLEPPEQECQRYVHYYSRPRTVQEDGWTVQGWPVHQADWKREILRSVAGQDDCA
jgi:hypothetical protein